MEVRPRLPLAGAAIAAAVGIAFADMVDLRGVVWAGFFAVSAITCTFRPRVLSCWLAVVIAFAAIHRLEIYEASPRVFAGSLTQAKVLSATGIVDTEPELVENASKSQAARFRLRIEKIENAKRHPLEHGLVQVRWIGAAPEFGDRVQLRGSLQPLAAPRNPGEFDFRSYAQRQGMVAQLIGRYPADCKVLESGCGNPVIAFAFKSRKWIRDRLTQDIRDDPAIADLIASMVLGMRGDTPDEIQDLFRVTGTLHLFAVSGLNVAMLAGIAWFFLKPFRLSRRASVFLTIPLLVFYALVTGLPASCVRATVMGSMILAGLLFDRPAALFNSLAAAALAILAFDTNQLFAPGFQFSFGLVLTIAVLANRFQRGLEQAGRPDAFLPEALWSLRIRCEQWVWRQFAGAAAVTGAAWLGSSAFTAGYFHLFSLASILANLIAVPIAFFILALGLLATVAGFVSSSVAVLFNNANWACTKALVYVVGFCARIPGGHQYVQVPTEFRSPVAEVNVLDVNEGGAIHLRIRGRDWLVDCGHQFEYSRSVLPYLRSRGINHIEALVLTHGDAQHIGAATDVWTEFKPSAVFDVALKDRSQTRKRFHQLLASVSKGKRYLQRGESVVLDDGSRLEVLYPPANLQKSTADDKAMVLRLTTCGVRTLMMSDAGFATEDWLIDHEPDLHADVIVKGWHSKDGAGTGNFLAAVRPKAVVIAGLGYRSHQIKGITGWLNAASDLGVTVFQQDESGAVQLRIQSDRTAILSSFVDRKQMKISAGDWP